MNKIDLIKLQEFSATKSKLAREAYKMFINNKINKENVIQLQRESNIISNKSRKVYLDYINSTCNYFSKYLKYKNKYLALKHQI